MKIGPFLSQALLVFVLTLAFTVEPGTADDDVTRHPKQNEPSAVAAEKPANVGEKGSSAYYLHAFTPKPDGSNETQHLVTIRFVPSQRIEVITNWTLTGQIDFKEGKWFADLKTSFNGGIFKGQVELGDRFETTMMAASPGIRLCSFAITRKNDPKELLKKPYFLIVE